MERTLNPGTGGLVYSATCLRHGTPSRDAIASLAVFPELHGLRFGPCEPVTDADIEGLEAVPWIKFLDLRKHPITDKGIEHILKVRELQHLNLGGTKVSDAGVIRLAALPDLESVSLHRTDVTKEGVAALRRARPDLKVSAFPPPDVM